MNKVDVTWYDCWSFDPWVDVNEAEKAMNEKCVCTTRGFIVSDNEDTLVICHSYNSDGQVTGSLHIPKGCIKKIKRY